ncbi:MAG: hypothetical protein AB7R69_02780 [Candidatus Babeliales bacterium]
MLALRILIFTLLLCFTHVFCSENIFQTLPPDAQDYLAQYLPFKGIESDSDLERIVMSQQKKPYADIETVQYSILRQSQDLFRIKKNTDPSSTTLSDVGEELLISLREKKEGLEALPIIGAFLYAYRTMRTPLLKNNLGEMALSANNRYICAMHTKEWTLNNPENQYGFIVIDQFLNAAKYIPLPRNFPPRTIITAKSTLHNKVQSLMNQGYKQSVETATHYKMIKFLTNLTISSNGCLISCADSTGVYCFDIGTCMHNQEPAWQRIKNFNGISEKIKNLEFNQQCTKIAFAYAKEGEQEIPVEIIALEGRKEPQKTLADYCRENFICAHLNK